MIQWMNDNQGFLMGVLTFVYVVCTLALVCLTWRSIKQVGQLEEARLRPVVVMTMEIRQKAVYAVLRNVGVGPAFGVLVRCNPPLMTATGSGERECIFSQRTMPVLAGGQVIDDLLGGSVLFNQFYPEGVYNCVISYHDGAGRSFRDSYECGLWHQMNRFHTSEDSQELLESARKGVEALERIARAQEETSGKES